MGLLDPGTPPLVSEFNKAPPVAPTPPVAAPAAAPPKAAPAQRLPSTQRVQPKPDAPKEMPPPANPLPAPSGGSGVTGALADIAKLEDYRRSFKMPSKPELPQKQKTATDDIQLWGALATVFAAFASMRTRASLTTAMNAGAAAMNAMHEGQTERVDQAFKQWEHETQIALKTAEYEQRAYEDLMNEITNREELRMKAGKEIDDAAYKQQVIALGGRKEDDKVAQSTATNDFHRAQLEEKKGESADKTNLGFAKLAEKDAHDRVTEAQAEKKLDQGDTKIEDDPKHQARVTRKESEYADVAGAAFKAKDEVGQREAMLKLVTTATALGDKILLDVISQGTKEGGPEEGLRRASDLLEKRKANAVQLKGASASLIHAQAEQEMVAKMKQSPEWQAAVAKGDFTKQLEMTAQVESALKGKTGKEATPWPPELIESMAHNIYEGRTAPFTNSNLVGRGGNAANPNTIKIMERVNELGKENGWKYDATLYKQKEKARQNLMGKDGDIIKSFTVLTHHIAFYDELAKALENNPTRPVNAVINEVATAFGMPEVKTFDMAKLIVGDEIMKAVTGTAGGVSDREAIQATLNAANSPEQLAAVSTAVKRLTSGQLYGVLEKYRTLIDRGWLTQDEVVPTATLEKLKPNAAPHSAITDPTKILAPGGKSLFDYWGDIRMDISDEPKTGGASKEITAGQAAPKAPSWALPGAKPAWDANGKQMWPKQEGGRKFWAHEDGTEVK